MKFTKKQRLSFYKSAIARIEQCTIPEGICVELGDISFGDYFRCPWIGWDKCRTYFPELQEEHPPYITNNLKKYKETRIKILQDACKNCEPKRRRNNIS